MIKNQGFIIEVERGQNAHHFRAYPYHVYNCDFSAHASSLEKAQELGKRLLMQVREAQVQYTIH